MTLRVQWGERWGDLADWRDRIAADIEVAGAAVARVVSLPDTAIVVRCGPRGVIPEIGMGGRAHGPELLELRVDPSSAYFATALSEGFLHRTVTHELHHCLRMAGPGYGRTLGEALVSEGLAGRFVQHLFAGAPEPWERAVSDAALCRYYPSATELAHLPYDHKAWFFGAGGVRPRWLGYTLGFFIVGSWLSKVGDIDGDTWVNVPAEKVLASPNIAKA